MSWPKKDIEAHIAFMIGFAKKLGAAGELVGAEGLAAPAEAKLVRAGKNGKPITDGVFPGVEGVPRGLLDRRRRARSARTRSRPRRRPRRASAASR